jgi:hypothetical protein
MAPIAMMIAELPVNPLPPAPLVVAETVGATVVVVGIDTLGWGKPGVRGLLPCPPSDGVTAVAGGAVAVAAVDDAAAGAEGSTSDAPRSATRTARSPLNTSYASGCSIAGVSGAST